MLAPNPGPGQTDPGLLNMVTTSFGRLGASDKGGGPNYCCCYARTGGEGRDPRDRQPSRLEPSNVDGINKRQYWTTSAGTILTMVLPW